METFRWNPCFVTGLADVDTQHQHLVGLLNQFGDLVMRSEGVGDGAIEDLFTELARYAEYHFAEEEALMKGAGVDARHVELHMQQHGGFLEEVTRLRANVAGGDGNGAKALLRFLTNWLAYHILGADQVMARQMTAIATGTRPDEAYSTVPDGDDPAVVTLLSALNELFQQVSDRNRELERINRTLEARVADRTAALVEANKRLADLANTDVLTDLPNRRSAMHRFAVEWQSAARDGTPLACLMIDADGFKVINDEHGHDAGDAVLRALARCLRHSLRTDDTVCRLGGDEFLVICARTPFEGAVKLAEAIRGEVAALRVAAGHGEWRGSVSIGVAVRDPAMTTPEDLVKRADTAVYNAKRGGRNRVATADS